MNLNEFLSKLEKVKKINFSEYTASCPAHDDRNPSLSVSGKDGKILLHCHGGCTPEEIVSAMGLKMSDLFTEADRRPVCDNRPERTHVYRDAEGNTLARKLIYRKEDGSKYALWERLERGVWHKGLGETKAPLYRLNELIDSNMIYIVEGEKDVDTMFDLGYTATTSPKGAGGKWEPEYNDHLSGKDIVIISDNDEAGEKYAKTVKEGLVSCAASIRVVPSTAIFDKVPHKGDISDILSILGKEKTIENLSRAVDHAKVVEYKPMPPYFYYGKGGILRVDRPALAAYIRKTERYLFELGEEDKVVRRLWYRDGVYLPIGPEEIRAKVKSYITDYNESCLCMADVEEVVRNILSDPNFVTSEELDADESIVNFKNGIYHLDTYKMTPHSPDIYSTVQLDCDWDLSNVETPTFDAFMKDLCGDNTDHYTFLMEFMAVTLSNIRGYRMKSALFMVGEGNTGKSQLKALCERILGHRNCAAIDLNTLEARFGTSAIYGKRLAGSSDLSYMSVNELKIFKQVTGGDQIFAERKGSSPFYYTYKGQLWFCMNKLPKFGGDRGDWVYDRINIVECNNVIPKEKRDKFLCDKMYAERSGIVAKAFMHLRNVISNGYEYTTSAALNTGRYIYQKENNPVANFYKQCCIPRTADTPKDSLTTTAMHKVFVRWCHDNEKGYKCSYNEFKKELSSLLNTDLEKLITRNKAGMFFNFRLNHEAYDVYYYPYM
ncbi:MAG: hypothetical protein IJB57_09980 [Clostridia bacterium]|nr:hypothetical protein [Clostridia bacterium]